MIISPMASREASEGSANRLFEQPDAGNLRLVYAGWSGRNVTVEWFASVTAGQRGRCTGFLHLTPATHESYFPKTTVAIVGCATQRAALELICEAAAGQGGQVHTRFGADVEVYILRREARYGPWSQDRCRVVLVSHRSPVYLLPNQSEDGPWMVALEALGDLADEALEGIRALHAGEAMIACLTLPYTPPSGKPRRRSRGRQRGGPVAQDLAMLDAFLAHDKRREAVLMKGVIHAIYHRLG